MGDITAAEGAYLDAFDAYLQTDRRDRDDSLAAMWKRAALQGLIRQGTGRDPDEWLAQVPLEPRGQQNTPRSNEKRRRRSIAR